MAIYFIPSTLKEEGQGEGEAVRLPPLRYAQGRNDREQLYGK
ncbi:MAG: hypothetical protein DDT21_02667 [Syntrophomonadaceae bacterium]|nr:hypothetical protein [Bacillota bacterium]